MFDSLVAGTSLQEMLIEQVRESALPEDLRPVAEMLIGNIDENGYVTCSLDEVVNALNDFLKDGAADYVLKERPNRLIPAIRRALKDARHAAERRQFIEQIHAQAEPRG